MTRDGPNSDELDELSPKSRKTDPGSVLVRLAKRAHEKKKVSQRSLLSAHCTSHTNLNPHTRTGASRKAPFAPLTGQAECA